MQYEHLDSKREAFLTGCLFNAVRFFFFSFLEMCALFLVFLSMLEVYNFTGDHPMQPGTMLALGSRDLGCKGTEAKSRRGVFPRLGWKVRLRLGESQGHRDREKREGRVRRGNLFLFSCSWASPQAHVSKRPPHSRWACRPNSGRMPNAGDLSNLRQIWWNGKCKDRFKKRYIFVLSSASECNDYTLICCLNSWTPKQEWILSGHRWIFQEF